MLVFWRVYEFNTLSLLTTKNQRGRPSLAWPRNQTHEVFLIQGDVVTQTINSYIYIYIIYIYIYILLHKKCPEKISPRGGLVYPMTKLAFGDCPWIQSQHCQQTSPVRSNPRFEARTDRFRAAESRWFQVGRRVAWIFASIRKCLAFVKVPSGKLT